MRLSQTLRQTGWFRRPFCIIGVMLMAMLNVQVLPGQDVKVDVRPPATSFWVGQRVPLFVELRAKGSFAGTASFDLPAIPGAIVIKIGNPVVSSETVGETTWFVQTHEFAFFAQREGEWNVPEFPVRFSHRQGFVGDPIGEQETVPQFTLKLKRPPGTESVGFLITTSALELQESWEPEPDAAQVGDVIKRRIRQRASNVSGMALPPAPVNDLPGIRIYTQDAETIDENQRGEFIGNRNETITYLFTEPGKATLPAITFRWWDPEKEVLESKTFPAVTVDISSLPGQTDVEESGARSVSWKLWGSGLLLVVLVGIVLRYRTRMIRVIQSNWQRWNPPDKVAARALIQACRKDQVHQASQAWLRWLATQPANSRWLPELISAVQEMERYCYADHPSGPWKGERLEQAFRQQNRNGAKGSSPVRPSVLPPLNP